MTRLLGGILESLHIIAVALLFGAAAILTWLTSPALMPDTALISVARAERLFRDLSTLVGPAGRVLAVVALVAAVLAPYVRNDARKAAAWMRIVLAAGALFVLVQAWGPDGTTGWSGARGVAAADVESHATIAEKVKLKADERLIPWSALALLTGLNLVVGAFMQFSGDASGKGRGKAA